jgi:Protein of unknown function (DUF1826)
MQVSAALSDSPFAKPLLPPPVSELERPDCSLAWWHRAVPPNVSRALAVWSKREAPRFECTAHEPATDLRGAFTGLPKVSRAWLERDTHALLQLMFDVSDGRAVTLEFGIVRSDQCRKFHVDYLRYRLITTYVGPGTEWVPNACVDRGVLLEPPEDSDQANAHIVKDQAAIQRAAPGDVLLMKGARHTHALGLVHRSPPVEHLGVRRVVLVLSVH